MLQRTYEQASQDPEDRQFSRRILPKELLAQLGRGIGGSLSVTSTSRGIELSVAEEEFDRQMEMAREIMVRRRRALRELAK